MSWVMTSHLNPIDRPFEASLPIEQVLGIQTLTDNPMSFVQKKDLEGEEKVLSLELDH